MSNQKKSEKYVIQDNPTRPRLYEKKRRGQVVETREHWARAPYNFVSLPEKMLQAPPVPKQDAYDEANSRRKTGYIDLTLETKSFTYIRGMQNILEFREDKAAEDDDKDGETRAAQQKQRADFYSSIEKKTVNGKLAPSIPGSTLRGLVRQLVEIVGHARFKQVGPKPTYTFRAVAVQGQDPLKKPYADAMGDQNNRKAKAGYLEKRGEKWFIHPAKTTKEAGWPGKQDEAYLRIAEEDVFEDGHIRRGKEKVDHYRNFGDRNYKPQIHKVSFEDGPAVRKTGRRIRGSNMRKSIEIGGPDQFNFSGLLVCAGNMLETGGKYSPRKRQVLIFEKKVGAEPIQIPDAVVEGYLNGLSTYVEKELVDWQVKNKKDEIDFSKYEGGCLGDGKPVFYIAENGQVKFFGHNPNFRIPGFVDGENRPATPRDLIPDEVLNENLNPDFAESIFGWVWGKGDEYPHAKFDESGDLIKQYAGRVFFEDAQCMNPEADIWYKNGQSVRPQILSTPRPTTFQHYLTQDGSKAHDPNVKMGLAWYGTPKKETSLRGYKNYWHKGAKPKFEYERQEGKKEPKTQLTYICPINPGVQFKSRIYFENLEARELGLLLWVLNLPTKDGSPCYHKIGMGKPLGLGAIDISADLTLTSRDDRYKQLFTDNGWALAESEAGEAEKDAQAFMTQFEEDAMHQLNQPGGEFKNQGRIQELLTMLRWMGDNPDAEWAEWTRYMQIEGEHLNEYVERPVLPTPAGVIRQFESADDKPATKPCENSKGDPALTLAKVQETKRGAPSRNNSRNQRDDRRSQPTRPQPRASETKTVTDKLKDHVWLVDPPKEIESKALNKPVKKALEVDMRLRTTVSDAHPGDPIILELENPDAYALPEDFDVLFWIKVEDLAGKKYAKGNMASVEIKSITKDEDAGEWVIDCRPKPKKK